MAKLILFRYREGNSFIHNMDPRLKMISLILITFVSLNTDIYPLILLTLFILFLFIICRFPVKAAILNLKVFIFLSSLVLIARGFTTPGSPIHGIEWLGITREGITKGFLFAWGFLLVVLLSSLFIATTSISQVKSAVKWFLKPIPFIPSERVGFMIGLTLRFIPLIIEETEEILQAQKTRCVENRKNPIYRISTLSRSIIRKTFERAEEVALAMEARCYSENSTPLKLKAKTRDWIAFVIVVIASFALLYFYHPAH